jgi:hypothetical protein
LPYGNLSVAPLFAYYAKANNHEDFTLNDNNGGSYLSGEFMIPKLLLWI